MEDLGGPTVSLVGSAGESSERKLGGGEPVGLGWSGDPGGGVGFVPFKEVGGKVVVVVGAGMGESCGSGVKRGKVKGVLTEREYLVGEGLRGFLRRGVVGVLLRGGVLLGRRRGGVRGFREGSHGV